MDKKTLRNDIILIVSLLLVAVLSVILVLTLRTKKNLIAKIHVRNEVVEVIDLTKKEDKEYIITGLHGDVHVHTHDGSIAIVKSNCPHQDCVKVGYVNTTNRPIICAYNAVYVTVEDNQGNSEVII